MPYTFGVLDRDLGKNVLACFLYLVFFNLICIIISLYDTPGDDDVDSPPCGGEVVSLYESWLVKHDRQYDDDAEKYRRFGIFQDNLQFIAQHNSRLVNNTYKIGLNRFADLTNEEYRSMFLGGKKMVMPQHSGGFKYNVTNDDELPESIDWRHKGAVAPVKDQGKSATSWAFSAVAAVEGINHIVTGELMHLSEQELVDDCHKGFYSGTSNPPVAYAFEFIVKNRGIHTDTHYPYKGHQDRVGNAAIVTLDGYENVPQNDEISLKKAVAHQPVSVAIDAGGRAFQLYESGVFTGLCGTDLEHDVVVVGYGTDDGIDYWIVRNSWGPRWGENGYIRLERNLASTNLGKCGIAMLPSYPTKTRHPFTKTPPQPVSETPKPVSKTPQPLTKALQPVCDDYYSCPQSTTCCCLSDFGNYCSRWGCCPLESATCCDDHSSCCPQQFPVCNINAKTCVLSEGSSIGIKAFKPLPAIRRWTAVSAARKCIGACWRKS